MMEGIEIQAEEFELYWVDSGKLLKVFEQWRDVISPLCNGHVGSWKMERSGGRLEAWSPVRRQSQMLFELLFSLAIHLN